MSIVDVHIRAAPETSEKMYKLSGETDNFRVRCEMDKWVDFRKFLITISKIHIVVFETPRNENPHVHALIESNKSEDAIKRARTRYFKDRDDMKGNAIASISACNHLEAYTEYLCKGRYAVKEKGRYRKAEEPNHNKIEIVERSVDLDYEKLYVAFWSRHATPMTKTQYKKRDNFTEELCREAEATFGFEQIRYIDNYSKRILEVSEEEHVKGWYVPESVAEIQDLKAKYKQCTAANITQWLVDIFCHRCKIFDEYIISRYVNLIINKYRHHFAHLLLQQKERIKNILLRSGYNENIDNEMFEMTNYYKNKPLEQGIQVERHVVLDGYDEYDEYDEEKHGTGRGVFWNDATF